MKRSKELPTSVYEPRTFRFRHARNNGGHTYRRIEEGRSLGESKLRFPVVTTGRRQIKHALIAYFGIHEDTLRLLDISGLYSSVFGGCVYIVKL